MLIIKNNKPDFKSLFKVFLDEYEKEENNRYYSNFWDNYDDWGDYDDWDRYYPCNASYQHKRSKQLLEEYQNIFAMNKSNKRGCRGSKNKSKCIPLYPNGKNKKRYSDSKNNMFDKRGDDKLIYFYDDIDSPEDVTLFYNVFDFDKFLDEEGISVSDSEVDNLLTRSVSHCCINPKERLMGHNTLLTDSSYGTLRWACAESNDELVDVKHKK